MPGTVILAAKHQHHQIHVGAVEIHRSFQRREQRHAGAGAMDHGMGDRNSFANDRASQLFTFNHGVENVPLVERCVVCKTFAQRLKKLFLACRRQLTGQQIRRKF